MMKLFGPKYILMIFAILPVARQGILPGKSLELLVHVGIEVIPYKEGPESEQGVHFLGMTNTHLRSLWKYFNT